MVCTVSSLLVQEERSSQVQPHCSVKGFLYLKTRKLQDA